MSAIEGVSVRVATLVDGTLRLTVDIEPRHAHAAFILFGAPHTPLAISALLTDSQRAYKAEAERTKESENCVKGGPWAQWLALRCKELAFQAWLGCEGEAETSEQARVLCACTSRAEIDGTPEVLDNFKRTILEPWREYCRGQA
jgi:hypothetical protein